MDTKRKIAWIGGWGCGAEDYMAMAKKHYPMDCHEVYLPTKETWGKVGEIEADQVVTYSMGAMIWGGEGLHLGPYVNFKYMGKKEKRKHEYFCGLTLKGLRRDALKTVNEYREAIGLNRVKALPYPVEDLEWGLEFLIENEFEGMLKGLTFLGGKDWVVPYSKGEYFEDCTVIEGCGHGLKELIEGGYGV